MRPITVSLPQNSGSLLRIIHHAGLLLENIPFFATPSLFNYENMYVYSYRTYQLWRDFFIKNHFVNIHKE